MKSFSTDDYLAESGDTVRNQLFATYGWQHEKNNRLRLRVVWPKLVRFCTGLLPEDAEVYAFGSVPRSCLVEGSKRIEEGELVDLSPLKEEEFRPEGSRKKKTSIPASGYFYSFYDNLRHQFQFDCKTAERQQGKGEMTLDFRPRTSRGSEKAVDVALCLEGSRIPENSTVYVFSGDGDMVPLYYQLFGKRCNVTVCTWSWNLSKAVESLEEKGVVNEICYLDKYYFHVTKLHPYHDYLYLRWQDTQKHDKLKLTGQYFEEKSIVDALLALPDILPSSFYIKWWDNGDMELRFFRNSLFKSESVKHDPAWKYRKATEGWLNRTFTDVESELGEEKGQSDEVEDDSTDTMEDLFQSEDARILQVGGPLLVSW